MGKKMPDFLTDAWGQVTAISIGAWRVLKRYRSSFGWGALALAVLTLSILPFDQAWLDALLRPSDRTLDLAARFIGKWGDFIPWSLPVAGLVWIAGRIGRKRAWQLAAIASLLASATAGMGVNCFRLTLGRPRPYAQRQEGLADGFYGLQQSSRFHGFPSGHAATSAGTAAALCVTLPPVGIPCAIAAGGVCWARMRLERHFPTDIVVGAAFGLVAGIAFGLAAQRSITPPNPTTRGKGNCAPSAWA